MHSEFLARLYKQHRLRWRFLLSLIRAPLKRYAAYFDKRQEDWIVQRALGFDLVCIIKSPGLSLYRRLRQLCRPRVIMDINDGLWLPSFRSSGWGDLESMLGEVHGVIAENDCVAHYARKYNSRVFVIPDAPQIEVFDRFRTEIQRDPKKVTLGWVGGSENVGPLYRLLEPLEALFARYPHLHLRVIGANDSILPKFEKVRWSTLSGFNQEEMVREVLRFDVGLFPLFHNEDGLARGNLKAKIYMSGQAAAVCEDYGENRCLIRDGFNGSLASTPEQWYQKLEWLINHSEERLKIAQHGLLTIRQSFTAGAIFSQMLEAYERILVAD